MNIDSKIVQTNNELNKVAVKCMIYKTNKSKFMKKPEEEKLNQVLKSQLRRKLYRCY